MKKKWIIIIGISLVVFIILFLLFILNSNKHIKIDKSVDINIGGYNQVVRVISLDRVKITGKKYVRIDMEIGNKKNVDSVTALHKFSIVDVDGNDNGICYHDSILPDNELKDIFPSKILASSKTRGYLYCITDSNDIDKLKVTVIAGGKIDDDGEVTYEYEDYYIDLK